MYINIQLLLLRCIAKWKTTVQLHAVNLQNLALHATFFFENIFSWTICLQVWFKLANVQLRYLVVIYTWVAASNFKCSSHRFVYFLWFSTNASFFDRLHDFSNVVFCWSICARFLNHGLHTFHALLKRDSSSKKHCYSLARLMEWNILTSIMCFILAPYSS